MKMAVVIQHVESPSGINTRRDAQLKPRLHKEWVFLCFAWGTYFCVSVSVFEQIFRSVKQTSFFVVLMQGAIV